MPLSDAAVRNAKPAAKPFKLFDGGGLHLLVEPRGSKLWRLSYRFMRKPKTLALGKYPLVPLADARAKRDDAKRLLARGIDPSAKRKADKAAKAESAANTFGAILDAMQAEREKVQAQRTIERRQWLMGYSEPLRSRPISEITAQEVFAVLQPLEAAGKYETASRLRAEIGSVFREAQRTAKAVADPTIALRGSLARPAVKPRAAITKAEEFGALLRAIDGFQGQPTTTAALKLMAILFQRPGELRGAAWTEFDLDGAVWEIPRERMKQRREAHKVPLPRQAIEILRDLHKITGTGELMFPSLRSVRRPISENTLNGALRRLGYAQDEMSSHGFRASASTLLYESRKWSGAAIERQLSHIDDNEVRRAYARGEHWDERVKMMTWWADYLDDLRGGKVVAVKFGKAAKRHKSAS